MLRLGQGVEQADDGQLARPEQLVAPDGVRHAGQVPRLGHVLVQLVVAVDLEARTLMTVVCRLAFNFAYYRGVRGVGRAQAHHGLVVVRVHESGAVVAVVHGDVLLEELQHDLE